MHPTKTSRKLVLKSVRPKRPVKHFANMSDRQTDMIPIPIVIYMYKVIP